MELEYVNYNEDCLANPQAGDVAAEVQEAEPSDVESEAQGAVVPHDPDFIIALDDASDDDDQVSVGSDAVENDNPGLVVPDGFILVQGYVRNNGVAIPGHIRPCPHPQASKR